MLLITLNHCLAQASNPDDTVEYLRKGRMPRNTDTGIVEDNPEDRKNILEWQKRVQEEQRQQALEAAKPVKGFDSRHTQPSPPSALDKVNKIMKD